MRTEHHQSDGWESWPPEIVVEEASSFKERADQLIGTAADELEVLLGTPGETVRGTQWSAKGGEAILHADRDLRYFNLLPHVVVAFAVAGGRVARISYLPKWRRCPAEFPATLLNAFYAPE